MLTAFVKAQEISALDEAVDVLDMLILDITRSAKSIGQKKRLRTLKDLDGVRLGKGKYPTLRLFFNHQLLANCPSGGAMPFLRPKPSDYVHHATDLYESRQNQKRTV
ncbi:hypothetical protein ABZG18_004949 [Citrobacter freundii]